MVVLRLLGLLIFLTFDLMVLGAAVRAMDAGLTCPDWPLCFGRVVPAFHWGVYFEFIHRAIAGIVAILFLILTVLIFSREQMRSLRFPTVLAGLLLLSQVIMGGLTVLNLLAYWTVTTHLVLATAFLAALLYINQKAQGSTSLTGNSHVTNPRWPYVVCLCMVGGQMILGGLVASTYSGLICVDFPTCNGQLIPTLSGPVGLQVLHRLGAYILVITLTGLFLWSRRSFRDGKIAKSEYVYARRAWILILLQVAVGILNLVWLLPPYLTVLHSALAIMIFMSLWQGLLIAKRQTDLQFTLAYSR